VRLNKVALVIILVLRSMAPLCSVPASLSRIVYRSQSLAAIHAAGDCGDVGTAEAKVGQLTIRAIGKLSRDLGDFLALQLCALPIKA